MKLKELIKNVQQWSKDRGLDKADSRKQLLKLYEEFGELVQGHLLEIISIRYSTTLEACLELAWNEIKDRKGKMVDGVFVKEEDLK